MWAEFISVFFLSATKFLFAPTLALKLGFNFWESIIILCLGGITGVTFFYFLGAIIGNWIEGIRNKSRQKKIAKGKTVKNKRKITPYKRRVVRIKNRFGLIGIAIVTPCIISIPVGSILASRFFNNHFKTLGAIYISVIAWAFILTAFNDVIMSFIENIF